MTHDELLAKQVANMHLVGISTELRPDSHNEVVDVTVKLQYFTACCGEPHEQQDAVNTIIQLFGASA